MKRSLIFTTGLFVLAAGCGSGSNGIPAGVDGAVVFRDSLADNNNGWINVAQTPHRNGRWDWNGIPAGGAMASPDALTAARVPAAVSVAVDVVMRQGAALRVVSCHEYGSANSFGGSYELGVDGRRALIRELKAGNQPYVLAVKTLPVANGRRVQITGRCIPDRKAVALTLLVDGKVIAQALASHPIPNGVVGVHAFARPDSPGAAALSWDDFVVRKAVNG